jgi:hypothetical protein
MTKVIVEINCNGSSCGKCEKIRRISGHSGQPPVYFCDLFGNNLGKNPQGHFMRPLNCLSAEENEVKI